MSTFERIWSEVLESEEHQGISVLEPACGSANDYRFIESYGIAKFLDYTGFDLCAKNICNARQICSHGRFKVVNVFEIDAEDKSFDYCFVHDLFEHLSVEAIEVAISELCRVTRGEICAGFFNMHDGEEHIARPVRDYHWNCLSLRRTKTIFRTPCLRDRGDPHGQLSAVEFWLPRYAQQKGLHVFYQSLIAIRAKLPVCQKTSMGNPPLADPSYQIGSSSSNLRVEGRRVCR